MGLYNYRKAEEMYKKVPGKGIKALEFSVMNLVISPAQLLFPRVYTEYSDKVLHLLEYFDYKVIEYIPRNNRGERHSIPEYFSVCPIRLMLLKAERRNSRY